LTGWIRKGLKCIKLGKNRYFLEEDIIEFLEMAKKEDID